MTRYRKPTAPGSQYSTPEGERRLRAELDVLGADGAKVTGNTPYDLPPHKILDGAPFAPPGEDVLRELIRELPQRMPLTVLLSSHMLSEVEQLASHVGVIRDGRLYTREALDAHKASKPAEPARPEVR